MQKDVILSGIQPSGKLHIGNFLGALSNFVTLQNSGNYNCFFTIVDYHSISEDYDPKDKPGQILDLAANFLAAGIDPTKSTLFIQSHVPEHLELAWILNSITPVSELERMTQFKDKSQKQTKNINAALFNYPVLMAADILIYKATAVPAGVDQKQHLELTNALARKFNNRYGKTFSEIKPLWTKFPKVMDLKKPDKKMSKSDPAGCVFLDDSPEDIHAKLKKATTATESGGKSAGEDNLMMLLEHFGKKDEIANFKDQQKNGSLKFSELKENLATRIADYFQEFREKKLQLLSNPAELTKILEEGSKKARGVATETLQEVKEKIGLL
ncbi:MAG: tryptophan--tRNA ligase [Candidatus Doudnabacteria bacterium CG10_big_fil_rev_8_21_14_0_10_42_18]|uniref:Tryptophan--tRNA ligase n=1 Tax=Candidatus Doudnabacteria bacterium CG10_big_fil_rev_8_21_14_0_10_42_18 TaxID=1974552 RepID=A0A2H0VDQ2_9BACT|nr:MAG: tryptophan--tRNA ligase [Candidatus Doudnabacteria bacterium CG10_big_fil_rev_8_21_14_0_10_42_18]